MKTPINGNSALENVETQETPASTRFVHIHAEAVNQRIREALGTNLEKKQSVAGNKMNPAHFFSGPHCVFFCPAR